MLHQWDSEHYKAWDQAKRYMMTELSYTGMDIDTDSDEDGEKSERDVFKNNIPGSGETNQQKCKKPPSHPLCSLYLTRGGIDEQP